MRTATRLAVAAIVSITATGTATIPTGWAASVPTPSRPVTGGHLTIAGEAEVGSPWTPAEMRCDSYCFVRARTFFDSLAAFGRDREVHGVLAESIEPNDSYTEWTITIRDGISFTDGTPVDADAVIFNLQAGATGVVTGAFLKDLAKLTDPQQPDRQWLKIDKIDEMTLVIYTGANGDPEQPLPWRDFPHLLTGQWGLIASPRWLEAVAENPELATQPVGSGPFVVDSFEPRGSLEVSRNPDYWMTDSSGTRLPYLDSITFRVIEDPETSVEALRAGDIDVTSTSNGVAITRVQDLGDEFSVTPQSGFLPTHYLLIDLDKPGPLQDRRVRCAMSLAIDREELIEVTTNGFGQVANALFSPGQQGFLDDNGLALEQDLDTAAAMIADYEADTGTAVELTLGRTPPIAFALGAELLLDWWSTVGIDATDLTIPQNDLITHALFGTPEFEVLMWRGHEGVLVDQQYLWWHSDHAAADGQPSLNLGRLRDQAIDAALDAARTSSTDEEAQVAAEEVNRVVARECYQIPLNWVPWAVLANANVHGLDEMTLPDGTAVLDPAGVNGQYLAHTLYLAER